MKKNDVITKLVDGVKDDLIGKKIVAITYLSEEEMKASYWNKRCPVLILEDGTAILPLSDDEGNESGVLEIIKINATTGILPSIY